MQYQNVNKKSLNTIFAYKSFKSFYQLRPLDLDVTNSLLITSLFYPFRRITYIGQYDATIAVLCLNKFEILNNQPIDVKFEDADIMKHLSGVMLKLQIVLKINSEENLSKSASPRKLHRVCHTNTNSSEPQASGITSVTNIPLAALETQNSNSCRRQLEWNTNVNKSNADHGI